MKWALTRWTLPLPCTITIGLGLRCSIWTARVRRRTITSLLLQEEEFRIRWAPFLIFIREIRNWYTGTYVTCHQLSPSSYIWFACHAKCISHWPIDWSICESQWSHSQAVKRRIAWVTFAACKQARLYSFKILAACQLVGPTGSGSLPFSLDFVK